MITKQAIEKAIEGGFLSDKHKYISANEGEIHEQLSEENPHYIRVWNWREFALIPEFWQALGKALGRRTIHEVRWYEQTNGEIMRFLQDVPWSHYAAALFYDLILNGVSTDEFWENVLK